MRLIRAAFFFIFQKAIDISKKIRYNRRRAIKLSQIMQSRAAALPEQKGSLCLCKGYGDKNEVLNQIRRGNQGVFNL